MTLKVDQPKKARAMRRRLRNKVSYCLMDDELLREVWTFIEEAYSEGYRAGHEDQMQMRIRDALERQR